MSFAKFAAGLEAAFKSEFAFYDFLLIVFIFIVMLGIIFLAASLPMIEKYLWEKEVFEFISEFKNFSEKELEFIELLIKKHKIKNKYKLLTSSVIFEKYLNMEIISVEESHLSPSEKQEKINFYMTLKKKLFHTDK